MFHAKKNLFKFQKILNFFLVLIPARETPADFIYPDIDARSGRLKMAEVARDESNRQYTSNEDDVITERDHVDQSDDSDDDHEDNESVTFEDTEYNHDMMTPGYICKDYFLSFSVRQEVVKAIRDYDIHDNEVFLAGYPRSGITWTQRIIGAMRDGPDVVNSPDYDLTQHFPFIEYYDIFNVPLYDGFELFTKMKAPRVVKTHLPCELIPRAFENTGKVVVVLRNPKDMIVSYYNLFKNLTMIDYIATFEEFFEIFQNSHLPYGSWFKWVYSYWQAKQDKTIKNVHFLVYEQLFINTRQEVQKLADYLGYDLSDEKRMQKVLEAICFGSMQNTVYFPGAKNFIRRGGVGGWKNVLSDEISAWIDNKIRTDLYEKGFPIEFTFELP